MQRKIEANKKRQHRPCGAGPRYPRSLLLALYLNRMKERCNLCSVVNFLCFWGDMPQAKWKRPTLFILSFIALVGGGYAVYYVVQSEGPIDIVTKSLCIFLGLVFLLGLITSVFGCNRCVARVFGSA